MKKSNLVFFLLLLSCIWMGCQKEEPEMELLPASEENFRYEETKGSTGFTVDENGNLYTITCIYPDLSGTVVIEKGEPLPDAVQRIAVYDLEGNCIKSAEVKAGSGSTASMWVKDEVLYYILSKSMSEYEMETLFAVDTRDWSVRMLATLPEFVRIESTALVGDFMYILGEIEEEQWTEEEKSTFNDKEYGRRNYVIYRINVMAEELKIERMKVNFPIGIYCTEQNTLMIIVYSSEYGYGLTEFDEERGTLTELRWLSDVFVRGNVSGCKGGFLCTAINPSGTDTAAYYVTLDGKTAQILPEEDILTSLLVYRKGFVFYKNMQKGNYVERICIKNTVRNDGAIRVLSADMTQNVPFGCGVLMENQVVSDEKFALKVLARDTDYDLFYLSSRETMAYNIRENGVFYPLNEVEGVQEYLDACFPYIKELATDEEGNIWMIPVKTAVIGLLYNREFCETNGVDLTSMDWIEFLNFTAESKKAEGSIADISTYVLKEQFIEQYLTKYDTFDTPEFRACAEQFRKVMQEQGEWMIYLSITGPIEQGIISECYYEGFVYDRAIEDVVEKIGDSDSVGVIGIPKISEDIKNVGSITFLAVNPASDRLEQTLDYITAFSKYMMTEKDTFLLEDETMYTDIPIIKEAYQMYADSEIYFQLDYSVLHTSFVQYLNGEIELDEAIEEMDRRYKVYIGE